MVQESRRTQRTEWPIDIHLGILDSDVDTLHGRVDSNRSYFDQRIATIEGKIDRLIWAFAGACITFGLLAISFFLDTIKG